MKKKFQTNVMILNNIILVSFVASKLYIERERDRQGERERNMHALKRGWIKESIIEMLIYLVS